MARLLLLLLLLLPAQVQAQGLRLVLPFAPGGSVDQVARLLAPGLSEALGQPVVIDNRGGAGGTIATRHVFESAPDGQTALLTTSGPHAMAPALHRNLPYDAQRDFLPVAIIGAVPSLLVARADYPARDLAALAARARRQQVSYGSAGPGSTMHVGAGLFGTAAGVELTHVPYRGAGPALQDLAAGNIDFLVADLNVLLGQVQGGAVIALAVMDQNRAPLLPQVATSVEQGMPSVIMTNWFGLFFPRGVVAARVAAVEAAVLRVAAAPDVAPRLAAIGVEGLGGAAALQARLAQDIAAWPPIIRQLGISIE